MFFLILLIVVHDSCGFPTINNYLEDLRERLLLTSPYYFGWGATQIVKSGWYISEEFVPFYTKEGAYGPSTCEGGGAVSYTMERLGLCRQFPATDDSTNPNVLNSFIYQCNVSPHLTPQFHVLEIPFFDKNCLKRVSLLPPVQYSGHLCTSAVESTVSAMDRESTLSYCTKDPLHSLYVG